MKIKKIEINWYPDLSIFASGKFLKAVGDEYGWLGGFDDKEELRCILPYTIVRKAIFRLVRFRVETIPYKDHVDIAMEKSFLNSAVEYFRAIRADLVMPAATNTIFQTYPDGAIVAPYGSYIIDLNQDEQTLWKRIRTSYRKNIIKADKMGVRVQSGIEYLDTAYRLVRDTFKRSELPFMEYEAFKRYILSLEENVKVFIADYDGNVQSCAIIPFSDYCAYGVYSGSVEKPMTGAGKIIQWEAFRLFRKIGVKRFDFVGARINPEKKSKQEAINFYKEGFGGKLRRGYMWKYSFHPLKYSFYCLAARLRSGGDIVDAERHKLKDFSV